MERLRWLVIGAGSAGCVVTRRLVDAGHDVVLVESGPPLAPGQAPSTVSGDDSFAALTPDRIDGGLVATRVRGQEPSTYLRGRGVGGSSAVNAMVALDGDAALYRSWGWTDCADARAQVLVPARRPEDRELGPVDRAVLAATPDATVAHLTRREGRRVTSAEAYLWPVHDADSLELLTGATVDRVVTRPDGSVAGALLADGSTIDADRVVLCAGAIQSPAVLLRSDLGLPGVGVGLQDHPAAAIALELHPDVRRTSSDGAVGLAVASLIDRDPIQILPMNHVGDPNGPALLLVALMRPRSASGTVTLRSTDPTESPVVDFDLLSDPTDVARLRAGVRGALDLLRAPPLDDIVAGAFIDDEGTPVEALATDAAIDAWLLARSADYVHASSSCGMGRVVDSDGAVPSVPGLHVCDASVFPTIPNVNTHVPTMMLAERLVRRWIDTWPAPED